MTGNGYLNIMHKLLNKHRDVTKTHHTGRQLHGSVDQLDDWYASLSVTGCTSSILGSSMGLLQRDAQTPVPSNQFYIQEIANTNQR